MKEKATESWKILLSGRMLLLFLGVAACILFDNAIDLPHHLRSDEGSLYYYFFGSISFGGLYGTFFASTLCAFPCVFLMRRYPEQKRFAISCIGGAMVYLGGYLFLFALLSLRMPMLMEYEFQRILEGGMAGRVLPYEKYILQGFPYGYFICALFMGAVSGLFFGAVAGCVSAFTNQQAIVITSPFVVNLMMAYFSKFWGIPNQYRLDMIYIMRAIIYSEEITMILCFVATICCVAAMSLLYRCGRRRKLHEQNNG